MNRFIVNAIRDVALFLLGICIGIIMECSYSIYLLPIINNKSNIVFMAGVIQLLFNALIINGFKEYIGTDLGFFVLGLLSPQLLILKKLFHDKLNGYKN